MHRGYPVIEVGRDRLDGQTFAYRRYIGEPPKGYVITASCSLKPCLRPEHLVVREQRPLAMEDRRGARNPMARLTTETVLEIRRWRAGGATIRAIAARFETSPGNVSDICLRRTWTDVA
jgi:hypothetical protein